ncbi:hypothetical protein [Nocardioides sp.]|uniref:hypothetical protein n=1 Tax=Nocardioides sp. TaxID=35761 RepID=UPI003D144BB7
MIQPDYARAEGQVLDAGRALEFALDSGDPFEIQLAARDLLRVTEARESAFGTVAGFRGEQGAAAQVDPDEELEQILSELQIGQTLLAAGAAVDDGTLQAPAASLPEALDQLETERRRRRSTTEVTARFSAEPSEHADPLVLFRGSLDSFLADLTSRTSSVATAAITGLTAIPGSVVQPWLTAAGTLVGEVPKVGALFALGLRALRRAVNALLRLVPQPVRDKVRELAKQWWDESGADGLAGRLLGVEEVRQHAADVLAEAAAATSLREGTAAIEALSGQHDRSIGAIKRILKLLSTLLGPLAASFVAAATWLYGAAAAGFAAGVAAALWIGRDCLDAGAGWERIDGVQVILNRIGP